MEALILVAERGGPTMFARIGMMRALNHGKPNPELEPSRKRQGLPDRAMTAHHSAFSETVFRAARSDPETKPFQLRKS